MFPSPKLRRASCSLALQPTRSAPLVSADVNNNLLKHLQVFGPFTLRFFTILPIVEIESLNTSVRVCVCVCVDDLSTYQMCVMTISLTKYPEQSM